MRVVPFNSNSESGLEKEFFVYAIYYCSVNNDKIRFDWISSNNVLLGAGTLEVRWYNRRIRVTCHACTAYYFILRTKESLRCAILTVKIHSKCKDV